MWEKALELASRTTHPVAIAAVAVVLTAFILTLTLRSRKKTNLGWFLAPALLVLGLTPSCADAFLRSRGLYRIRLTVLDPDHVPVDDARVFSSIGGEFLKMQSGWEFDVPPQIRPADGKVELRATVKNAFLSGGTLLILADDYYPTASIQLAADTSATVRGVVVDDHRKSVSGARVSISGYSDLAVTDEMGNFVLPAHAADGQPVQIRAQKNGLSGSISAPAGANPVELVISHH
jgi:hypothetical protein